MLDLLRRLLPRPCPGCGAQLGREVGLCANCRSELHPHIELHSVLQPQVQPHLVTLGVYRGVTRRAIRALKYGGTRDLARPLGQALAGGIPADWQVCAVIPVPLHANRQRERGYNQSALLAQAIADALQVPYVPALVRTRATAQQAKQHAAQRAANLSGAFQVQGIVPSGTVLLVDDVMTTGATLLACRDALAKAGQSDVKYAVVAR